ncbi:MAG TPA: hypothetical protein PK020_11550 [Ilumatobacteraceae bacterium]|nr:hypothetical protein [Ilumatobacteraceae bacterium]HRB02255.1 hypothetical protein [Ilumatobacteraceae bacterium]
MVSAAVPDDLAFWRSLSMRADWIFSTPSFTEMLKYADVVVVARVASVSEAEPLEVEDLGTQLTNVDLHLEVVEGSFPSGVSDPVLRVEAPGSLGPDAAGSFEAWLQTFGSRLPTNYAVLVLRQRPDAPPNVYQILNEWSILVQDTDSVTTAFTEEDRVVPVASYEKVMGTVKSLDELYLLLLDARALEDAEA